MDGGEVATCAGLGLHAVSPVEACVLHQGHVFQARSGRSGLPKHMLELEEIESDSEPEHIEGDALLLRRLDHLDWLLPLEDRWEARLDHVENTKYLEHLMGGLDLEGAPEGPAGPDWGPGRGWAPAYDSAERMNWSLLWALDEEPVGAPRGVPGHEQDDENFVYRFAPHEADQAGGTPWPESRA